MNEREVTRGAVSSKPSGPEITAIKMTTTHAPPSIATKRLATRVERGISVKWWRPKWRLLRRRAANWKGTNTFALTNKHSLFHIVKRCEGGIEAVPFLNTCLLPFKQ